MATTTPLTNDPNELMSCPYNKAHQIIRSRMQTHLAKCKKAYPEQKLLECPYNTIHKVLEAEYMHHVETCKDREKLDSFVFRKDTCDLNKFPLPNIEVETEENWDDVNVPSYDPTANCMIKPVLRNINLLPAAARKNFRVEERRRHQQLQNGKIEITKTSKEKATDYTKRQLAAQQNMPDKEIDENDPYSVTSLADRIKMGAMNIQQTQLSNTDAVARTDNSDNGVKREEWQKVGKKSHGRGRGCFLKSTN